MKDMYFYILETFTTASLKLLYMLHSVLAWKIRIYFFIRNLKFLLKVFPVGLLKTPERTYFIYLKYSFVAFHNYLVLNSIL